VIVENSVTTDEQALILCRDLAKRIEAEATYPGQVKVSVIRETRASDYAK
jgi:ribonucrease Y